MTPGTSTLAIVAILFARGLGLAGTMMPAMAAAYAAIDTSAVPRATSALNVIQRVGGSNGTAVLAVVLQHQITSQIPGSSGGIGGVRVSAAQHARVVGPLRTAFGHTFWWAVGLTLVAIVPSLFLMRATRHVSAGRAPSERRLAVAIAE